MELRENQMIKWDREYSRRGIPSSFRDEPSGVLTWTLTNWHHLTGFSIPESAVDIGCGTGRNPLYMAKLGISVLAFDSSEVAIRAAHERSATASLKAPLKFLQHDLTKGIPANDGGFDLATDI